MSRRPTRNLVSLNYKILDKTGERVAREHSEIQQLAEKFGNLAVMDSEAMQLDAIKIMREIEDFKELEQLNELIELNEIETHIVTLSTLNKQYRDNTLNCLLVWALMHTPRRMISMMK